MREAEIDEAPAPAQPPEVVGRRLLFITAVAAAVGGVFAAAWLSTRHAALFESPLLWVSVVAFWFVIFNGMYAVEIRGVEREVERRTGLEVEGVRILWLPRADLGSGQAALEVRVRSSVPEFPRDFALYMNLNFTWSFYVVGLRANWQSHETGVILLAPRRTRFLPGATVESLNLPSTGVASIRGLWRAGGEFDGLPSWGRLPGARASAELESLQLLSWLVGPEQPFVACEALEGRVEKWWPPILDRICGLDADGALDLLRVLRAIDRDIVDERGRRLTSSPSSPPP